MSVKALLEKYDLTQEEMAAFTGIPRDRISKWVLQNREAPPKANDAKIFEVAGNYFTNKSKEEVKALVKKYTIKDGKLVALNPYDQIIDSPTTGEEELSYDKIPEQKNPSENEENINWQYPYKTEENIPMTERLMRMIDRSIANEERITIALERVTRTNENLTMMLSHIVIPTQPESVKK